jgi:hypothetical protein
MFSHRARASSGEAEAAVALHKDLDMATHVLRQTQASFVIVQRRRVFATSQDHSIRALLAAAERLRAARLSGAALADRVLGRAALLVSLWAGIRACHGETMSEDAIRQARERGLTVSYDTAVSLILNRDRTGPCPFEAATLGIRDPDGAVVRLREVIDALERGNLAAASPAARQRPFAS